MQPGDGYIDPSQFKLQRLDDGKLLNKHKNILTTIIGLTVDYLTRFAMTGDILEAFKNSCKGVWIAVNRFKQKSALITAKKLLLNIKGLYNDSVINACKMVTYDGWYRNPKAAKSGIGVEDINPDLKTIENIQVMVERCLKFLEEFGPIIQKMALLLNHMVIPKRLIMEMVIT